MSLPEVLIVDDDRLLRTMVKDALADVPCVVREADSGDEALSVITEREPAVVVLDLVMPGKSGLELLKTLKSKGLRTRILVLSSLDTEALVQQAMADGAHGYLAKPIHPLDVQNVVRAALEAVGAAS
ncbi:MAG: response regulator transcription factor [Myxococcales bacterium]|nr:response regulator transcription factor [Myxococcales bacterium]